MRGQDKFPLTYTSVYVRLRRMTEPAPFRHLQFSGEKMKDLRIAAKYSRRRLGIDLGVTSMTIYNWEAGIRTPGANPLWKMAALLQTKVTAFYE